jgi:ADP-ribosylglycohydrolase
MEAVRRLARWSAEVTHNHPEGVKGAEAVAAAIYLARTGSTKEEIKAYIESEFGYDLSWNLDELRPYYSWAFEGAALCQGTVPQAICCVLAASDFEDAVRNAVSLGGDSDTLACITGSIAEPLFGIPQRLYKYIMNLMQGTYPEAKKIVLEFEKTFGCRVI